MRHRLMLFALAGTFVGLLLVGPVAADALLAPGDPIIAIDTDAPTSNSSYPGPEGPSNTVDGTLAKYLNFGGRGAGFIVTPAAGSSMVQSFELTTANDSEGRDPATWELYGTNDPITSLDDSDGLAENWTLVDAGAVALPAARDTLGPVIAVTNTNTYTSYKMFFPTIKSSDPEMQIAEASFYESNDGSGSDVLNVGDPILAIHYRYDSNYPGGEPPANVIDGTLDKYLNFGAVNSGFIVTPSTADAVRAFQITTANDSAERDPSEWALYGTNDSITSTDNSQGNAESWVLVDSGPVDLPPDRDTVGPWVTVDNDTAFSSYRMVFTDLKNAGSANSMQIAEVQFFNVPEPSTCVLCGIALLGLVGFARRRV